MAEGRINKQDIFDPSIIQEGYDIDKMLQVLLATFKQMQGLTQSLNIRIEGGAGIRELMSALNEAAGFAKVIKEQRIALAALADALAKKNKAEAESAKTAQQAALAEQKLATERERTRQQSARAEQAELSNAEAKEKNRQATERQTSEYQKLLAARDAAIQKARELGAVVGGTESEAFRKATTEATAYINQINQINAAISSAKTPIGNTPLTDRTAEITQLQSLIKTNTDLANSERNAAAANQLAAAQSTNAAQRSTFEAAAKQNLVNAATAEMATKDALAAANANVATEVQRLAMIEQQAANEMAKLTQASYTQGAAFEQEVNTLLSVVQGHNTAAATYRAEAAEKSRLAATTQDVSMKSLLEKEVVEALTRAQNEEIQSSYALQTANRNVATTVNGVLVAEKQLTEAKNQLEAATQRELMSMNKNISAYQQLKNEYQLASHEAMEMAAKFVLLQRNGTASAAELQNMRNKVLELQKTAQAASNTLLQMEQAVGRNQRAVGAYANATTNIVQVMRELPNFAISAQIGIMSLSNNIPMLVASLGTLARTVDVNTGKMIGWSGALKTVGASIFSWQGLIILATSVAVKYSKEISEFLNLTPLATRVQRELNKAMEEGIKAAGDEIAKLMELQAVLNNQKTTLSEVAYVRQKLIDDYPEFLGYMRSESTTLESINNRIGDQIKLIRARKLEQTADDAMQKAEEEYEQAMQKLNSALTGQASAWDKVRGAVTATNGQFWAVGDAMAEVEKAETKLNIARAASNDYMGTTIASLEKAQMKYREEIDAMMEHTKQGNRLTAYEQDQIKMREGLIAVIELQIRTYKDLILARQQATDWQDTDLNNEVRYWDARAKMAKDGSKEELEAQKNHIAAQREQSIEALRKDLIENQKVRAENLEDNETYNTRVFQINAEAQDKLEKLQSKHDKKKKGKKPWDPTMAEIKGREDLNEAINAFAKQRVETEMAANKAVFDNETTSLHERLIAYEEYVKGQQQLLVIQENNELNSVQIRLAEVAEAEAIDASKRSAAQKTLILDKEALLLKEKTLLEKFSLERREVLSAAQKKEREIINSSIKYQVQQQANAYSAIGDEVRKDLAMQIAALTEKRDRGEVSEKEFWRMRQTINASESELLFKREVAFLEKRKDAVIALLDDPKIPEADRKALYALRDNLEEEFGKLQSMRPAPMRSQKKGILSLLGLAPSQDMADLETARKAYDESVANYDETARASYQKIEDVKKAAAETFGDGTAEYGEAVKAAEEEGAKALQQAAVIRDAALDAYQNRTTDSTNKAKERIVKEIENLGRAIWNAYNSIAESAFNQKMQQLDLESKLLQENLKEELAANEASLDSKEEKERKEREINARAAANEKRLASERARLEREEAARKKRIAIFEATVASGQAIAQAFADYPFPASAIIAGLVAAATLANIAAIASQPLPAYWQGTPEGGHPADGPALVSERGPELGILPTGRMFMTPSSPTIMDLPKGTEIIPNHELASYTEQMTSREMQALRGRSVEAESFIMIGVMRNALMQNANKIVNAIVNKKEFDFHWDNGELRKSIKSANSVTEFISNVV